MKKIYNYLKKIGLIKYIVFTLMSVFILFPVYWVFKTAITKESEIFSLPISFFPKVLSFENFINLFKLEGLFRIIMNSLIYAIFPSVISVFLCFLAAYAFARIKFRFSNFLIGFLLLSSALPTVLTLVPLFEIFLKLKLQNTYLGINILIISSLLPFTVYLLISFIKQIPIAIEEAAIIDGASTSTIIFKIILPLSRPVIASLLILNFIGGWNEMLFPFIFGFDNSTQPLSVKIAQFSVIYSGTIRPWGLLNSMSFLMMMLPLILAIIFQRQIISGLTQGSLK